MISSFQTHLLSGICAATTLPISPLFPNTHQHRSTHILIVRWIICISAVGCQNRTHHLPEWCLIAHHWAMESQSPYRYNIKTKPCRAASHPFFVSTDFPPIATQYKVQTVIHSVNWKLKHTLFRQGLFFLSLSWEMWQWASLNARKPINNAHAACYSSNSLCCRGSPTYNPASKTRKTYVFLSASAWGCSHMPALECMSERQKALKALTLKPFTNGKRTVCFFSLNKCCSEIHLEEPEVWSVKEIPILNNNKE